MIDQSLGTIPGRWHSFDALNTHPYELDTRSMTIHVHPDDRDHTWRPTYSQFHPTAIRRGRTNGIGTIH